MKKIKSRYLMFKFVLGLFALSGVVAFAATNETVSRALDLARPDVKVQVSGSVKRNDKAVSVEKVESVKSGEILDWNINSNNEGAGDAKNYRVVGQVPAGTIFVADSAKAENAPEVSYSIDNGKNFSAKPMMNEKQADGSMKEVAAPISMYTQIKFEWAKPLASQNNVNASYRVRVK